MSKTIHKLKFPIEADAGKKLTELQLGRFNRKQLRAFDAIADDDDRTDSMIKTSTGISQDELDRLDVEDFVGVQEVLSGFLGVKTAAVQ